MLPQFILAPMDGVMDAPMRRLLTEISGIDLTISEFVRITHLIPPKKVIHRVVPEALTRWKTSSGVTVFPQLLGSKPHVMAKTAELLAKMGAPGIDLNFGCPAETVIKHDGGSALLKEPDRITAIVKAVREAFPSDKPVTAKTRLGWRDPEDIFSIAEAVVRGGADWITVHARTRFEDYTKAVHWDLLRKIRKILPIPLVANGDILSTQDYHALCELTGCSSVMIGRGALQDPYIFQKIRYPHKPLPQSPRDMIIKYVLYTREIYGKRHRETGRVKQFVKSLGILNPTIRPFFDRIKNIQRSQELDKALEDLA